MEQVDFRQLQAVLEMLAGLAGATAWAVYFSNWFRNMKTAPLEGLSPIAQDIAEWVRALRPATTQLLHVLGSTSLPALAMVVLGTVPPEFIAKLQPYYASAATLALAYLSSQAWYLFTKNTVVVDPNAPVG